MRSTLAVPQVGNFGLFPPATLFSPVVRPVVIDANWLHDDVLRVCRSGRPTVLVTCATEDYLRPFVAPHVMLEVEEHTHEWSTRGRVPVALFAKVWRDTYWPLLRIAEPDLGLLTAAERVRIETLQAVDPDDVPSVTLAILLRAPYISTDGPPCRGRVRR
jgi:predicted nucleic acid-binding protein